MRQLYLAAALVIGWSALAVGAAGDGRAQDWKPDLVVGMASEPDVLDVMATRSPPAAWGTLDNIVEPLVAVSPEGNLIHGLAAWEISADDKTITFKLRPGLTFHSGDPVTAHDIAFSHERAMKRNPRYPGRVTGLEKVEVVDDLTVNFVFKEPDATYLPARYLQLVSKRYLERVGEERFVAHPVGAGPYKFVSYKLGSHMDLEAFDNYWGGAPPVKRVRLVFARDDTTRVAMLRAGEADLIMGTPYAQVAGLKKEGFNIVSVPAHPSVSLWFTQGNPKSPFADRRVRLAIAHAIDADAIVKGLFHGVPFRFARLEPGAFGYDPDLKPYPYDPARARRLLAEAGYPRGFDMELNYYARLWPGFAETAEAVLLYLKAVGINATVRALEGGQINELIRKTSSDPAERAKASFVALYPQSLASIGDPTANLTIQLYSKAPFSLYANPAFDEVLERARRTLDDKKREEYVRQALRVLHEDVGTVQLWNGAAVYAMKPTVGYTPIEKIIPRMDLKMLRMK